MFTTWGWECCSFLTSRVPQQPQAQVTEIQTQLGSKATSVILLPIILEPQFEKIFSIKKTIISRDLVLCPQICVLKHLFSKYNTNILIFMVIYKIIVYIFYIIFNLFTFFREPWSFYILCTHKASHTDLQENQKLAKISSF